MDIIKNVTMVSFVGLFVVSIVGTTEFEYVAREMTGNGYPKNEVNDISTLVLACNNMNKDESIQYVDMYGIYINERMEYWEVLDD